MHGDDVALIGRLANQVRIALQQIAVRDAVKAVAADLVFCGEIKRDGVGRCVIRDGSMECRVKDAVDRDVVELMAQGGEHFHGAFVVEGRKLFEGDYLLLDFKSDFDGGGEVWTTVNDANANETPTATNPTPWVSSSAGFLTSTVNNNSSNRQMQFSAKFSF